MNSKFFGRIKVFVLLVNFACSLYSFGQLKDVYESAYFTNGGFINPANIINEDKYFGEINIFTYSPSSNNSEGAYKSFSSILSKSLGKNGSVGVLFDVNSVALFNQSAFSAKYAYFAKFSDNLDLAMGFSVGFKNARIDENGIDGIKNTPPDPLVSVYNSRSGSLYSDFGINLRFKNLHVQGTWYDITNKVIDMKQISPKLFASLDYTLNTDVVVIKPFGGFTQYTNETTKIIGGTQLFFNPIAISGFYSTLKKITVALDLYVSDNFIINLGYVFGPYYSNPVYGQSGNIVAGLKYTIP